MNLKLAIRNLIKDRSYTLLNIAGLAVAMAAFLLIIQYVKFERSYECFYPNVDNIYRITLEMYKDGTYIANDCETHPPVAPLLKEQIPEVKDYVRMQRIEQCEVKTEQNKFYLQNGIYAADASVFSIFPQHFIAGDAGKALKGPMDAVLTASVAHKYFGDLNPIGQTLNLLGKTVTVTGVIKDVPGNTHLKFSILLSFHFAAALGFEPDSWVGNNNFTYLAMKPGTQLTAFNSKLAAFTRAQPQLKDKMYVAEPVKDIHLFSRKAFEPEVNGDDKTVKFLLIVAFLTLTIGVINYINLTTARSGERMKEASIKKILGASRFTLINQFLGESFIINVLAFALALGLIQLALPFYNNIVGKAVSLDMFTTAGFWGMCAGLFLLNGLLSGLYPAYALSSSKPVSALSRSFTNSQHGSALRKTLVISQFTIASVVLVASIVVYQQLSFMRQQRLGMNINQVLVLRAPDIEKDSLTTATFKNELQQLAGVSNVSRTACVPGLPLDVMSSTSEATKVGDKQESSYNYYVYGIDNDFIKTLDIPMVAGSGFSKGSSYIKELIINEEACRLLGFDNPQAAIGKKMHFYGEYPEVVGVMRNFHQRGLKEALLPMIHYYQGNHPAFFAVKLTSDNIPGMLAAIEKKWESSFNGHPFEYFFLDDTFNQQYQADNRLGKLVNIFSVFTIFITCLGLMGLATYNVSRRTREIGIRKVLGSSVTGIIQLLTRDFIKLVIIAIIIASPIAWLVMHTWLQDFVYRISIPWWVFVVTGGLMLIIAVCTIGLQSMKTALMNPVKSLRRD